MESMKRLLLRVSLLTAVVGLGTIGVIEAKRLLHREPVPAEPAVMARHEIEPRPIPLAAEGEMEPGSNLAPYSPQMPDSDVYADRRPIDPRRAAPIGAGEQQRAQYLDANRGAADPSADDFAPPPRADSYAEPGRLEADTAAAPLGGQPDHFGLRGDRLPQAVPDARQVAASEDPDALQPVSNDPAQDDSIADDSAIGAPRDFAAPRDLSPQASADRWQDNFAPPAGAAGNRQAVQVQPDHAADGEFRAGGTRDNPAAAARADEGTGRPGEKQLEGAQAPSVTIEKRAPAEIQVGKPATFTIVVRNTGSVAAQGVEVHDVIPHGTQLVSTNPPAKRGPQGELIWELATLKPNAEATVQVQLMPLSEGEIGSVATLHFSAHASARTNATRPQLAIDVSAPQRAMIGSDVLLKIRLSNPGTGAATGVVMTEVVPPGLKHTAGSELEFEVGTLKPGDHRELDLVLTAAQAGPVTNLLTARAEGNVAAEARTQLDVIAPALKVDLTGPKRRYLERSAVYNISVSNPGTAPAKDVVLTATLPKGLKFVEANNAGQYDPATGAVYWSMEELPPQETGTVTLTALPTEPGELKLHIQGRAQQGLTDEHDETVVVEGIAAILFELVDVNDPIEIGGETSYEIRVINQGSKAANNVRLVALLPPQMQALSAEGPVRYVVDGQRVLFDSLSQLAPKADTTYTVKVKALEAGDLRLRVQVVTDEIRTPITKEESTRVYSEE
jgi:uncharacterized repeat protein (TIGR01451 family)